jgi:hypothetical protein
LDYDCVLHIVNFAICISNIVQENMFCSVNLYLSY